MSQHTEDQVDMFDFSPKKQQPTNSKPPLRLTFVKDLGDLPIKAKPIQVVRINPTTICIFND
jgi:hypothetical protein